MPGNDFRLLVVGDKLVAAARRDPPKVVGDGVHTIAQLVDQVNLDPRRGSGHSTSLTKIRFDAIAHACLADQGLTAESVPELGQRVNLRNNANLSTGGSATDVTDDVHPEVAARAIAAAHMVGLDICGVDVVSDSILQPLEDQGGGVVEVNAAHRPAHAPLRHRLARAAPWAKPSCQQHVQKGAGRPHPHRGGDRYQWQDHHGAPDFPPAGTQQRFARGHDQYRRRLRQRRQCIDTGDCSGPKSARNALCCTPTPMPPCWKPRAVACCAKVWPLTAVMWRS